MFGYHHKLCNAILNGLALLTRGREYRLGIRVERRVRGGRIDGFRHLTERMERFQEVFVQDGHDPSSLTRRTKRH